MTDQSPSTCMRIAPCAALNRAVRLQAVLLSGAARGFEFRSAYGQRIVLSSAVAAFMRHHTLTRADRVTVDFWLQRWRS